MEVVAVAVFSLWLLGAQYNVQATESWNHKVLYKATANLTCKDNNYDPLIHPDARYQWILPSGEIIKDVLSSPGDRHIFLNNGSTLLISDIDQPDFGLYFCLVTKDVMGTIFAAIRLGINIDGPYFGDMWQMYLPNLRIALVASGTTFIVMSMFCYNHTQFQNRYDKPRKQLHSHATELSTGADGMNMTLSNLGFVGDENECKEDVSENHKHELVNAEAQPKTKL